MTQSAHPSHILSFHDIKPKKGLGQNFLFEESVLADIADSADLTADSTVLEIGPGLGALTQQLADRAGRVVAVELDDRLMPVLRQTFGTSPHVELIHGDILDQDPDTLFANQPYAVVGNVPYYITGAILRHLLDAANTPTTIVMTVQKEVAARLAAKPGGMSVLGVVAAYYGTATVVRTIKAGAFWPRPNVDSAVIRIVRHAEPVVTAARSDFLRVVKVGFSQKRKQLKNNLRAIEPDKGKIGAALESAEIDGRRRAETLSVQEWDQLTHALYSAN